jgi:hypothetical protein
VRELASSEDTKCESSPNVSLTEVDSESDEDQTSTQEAHDIIRTLFDEEPENPTYSMAQQLSLGSLFDIQRELGE